MGGLRGNVDLGDGDGGHAVRGGGDRSLQTLRTLLTDPAKMEAVIKLMCASDRVDGMLSRMGHQLTQFKDKELFDAVRRRTGSCGSWIRWPSPTAPRAAASIPADLLDGKMTVYLVLPPEHMRAQSRLCFGCGSGPCCGRSCAVDCRSSRRCISRLDEGGQPRTHGRRSTTRWTSIAAMGCGSSSIYQSLGQLKKCFPDGQDQTLLSNTTQVFFGVNDQQTAEYVSARLGKPRSSWTAGDRAAAGPSS